jgi:hypothetical protein
MSTTATTGLTIVEGVVRGAGEGTVVLARAGTDYALELESSVDAAIGEKVRGEIRLNAAKITVIETGGKYIEPLEGTPRRVAGRIVEIDRRANLLVVDAGPFVVVCTPGALQKAARFEAGQMVTMGVMPGASFKAI